MTQASNSGGINPPEPILPPEPIIPGLVSTDLSQYDSAQNRYCFQIAENSAPGTVIGRIRFDGGVTGQAFYTLIGPDTDKVALQPDGTLILRAGAALDFEAGGTLHIEITAIFFGSDGSVAYAETEGTLIKITDVNEAPELTIGGSQSADIPEGTSVAGETGFSVTSTDPDAGDSVSYSLSDSRFEIVDGKLRVKADQNFDFETEPAVEVTITATDQSGLTDQETVSITIGDVNERPFLALRGTQTLVVREGTSTGAENLGIRVIAADPDGDNLTFTVSDDRFDVQDGQLVVRQDQTFDFESEPSITLTVTALDPGGLEFAQTVSIAITNVNERPAMSFTGDQTLMLNEGRSVAAELGIGVITIDPDAEDSVTYTLSDDRFEIVDGRLMVKDGQTFDFESEPFIDLTVTATDSGGLTSSATTRIEIKDVNEAPTVNVDGTQTLNLREGTSAAGDTGFTVTAADPDSGDRVTFSVDDKRFEVTDGRLRVKDGKSFDFESEPTIEVTITGTDTGGLTHTGSVTIEVTDVPEAPVVSLSGLQTLTLREGSSSAAADTGIAVSAADGDGDDLTFTTSDDRFEVADGVLRVKADQQFDFESEPQIEVTITGTDPGGLSHSQTTTITVTDVNEPPVVTIAGSQTLTLNEGTSVAGDTGFTVTAADPDAGDSVTLGVDDDRFEIVNGALRVKDGQAFDFESGSSVNVTITAIDGTGLSSSTTASVTITNVNEAPILTVTGAQTLALNEGDSVGADTGFTVSATDPDADDVVTLSVNDDRFEITDGKLRIKDDHRIDFESEPTIDLVITATDQGGLTDTQSVTIAVTDVNEPPYLVDGNGDVLLAPTVDVAENQPGAVVLDLNARDPEGDAPIRFFLRSNHQTFTIDNNVLKLRDDVALDFEASDGPQTADIVLLTNSGGRPSFETVRITVNVTDVNEMPELTIAGSQTLDLAEGFSEAADTGFMVSTTDPDAADSVTFSVNDDRFEVVNGALRVKADQSFDFETEPAVEVTITATDRGGLTDTQTVSITITDVEPEGNQAPAMLVSGSQTLVLNEGISDAGDMGFTVSATDPNRDDVTFSVDDDRFEMVSGALRVKANQSFDFESEPSIEVTITASDPGGLTDSQTVTVTVTDVNEAPTVSISGSQTLTLNEGTSVAGDTGFTVSATDPDNGDSVSFSVDDNRFEVVNGALQVKADQSFDFEREPSVDLVITGTDQGSLTHSQSVTIAISNVNEAPTVSASGSQTLQINEGISVAGDTGLTFGATDPDAGDIVTLTVDDDRFELVNGALRVKADQSFDFESEPTVDLVITGTDQGGLTDSQAVTVAITNVNEAPTISVNGSQTLQLSEGTSVAGDTGFTVSAADPDQGDSVEFSVDDTRFEIINGALRVKADQSFDFESEPSVDLVITGTDQGGLTHAQSVTIAITNVNEAPTISVGGSQTLWIHEGSSVAGDTGFTFSGIDPDAGDSVSFSVDDDRFAITDGKLQVKADQSFDFESEPTVDVTITGTDEGGLTDTQTVTVEISNVSEAPTVAINGSQTLTLREGTSLAGDTGFTVTATDPDKNDIVNLSVNDARFEIINGALRVKADQSFDYETEPSIDVSITATDKGDLSHTQTVTIQVSDGPEPPTHLVIDGPQTLTLNEGTSVAGDTGFTVSATDPDAGDSVSFLVDDGRFEITNGSLRVKAGQSFDFESEPVIDLTITATDSAGLSISQTVSIEVTDVNEAPTVSIGGSQTLQLNEGTSVAGDTGFTVTATDPDSGDSVGFSVDDDRFEVVNGSLRVKDGQAFDFETEPSVDLVITGTDTGGLTHKQGATIAITNVNEAPTVSIGGSQTLRLNEGTSVAGDTGFTVSATDPDEGDSVSFSVDDARFEIVNGALRVKAGQSFDFEAEPSIDLVITGTDQGGLSHTQTVTIEITDVPETPHPIVIDGSQTLRLNEGISVAANTGFTFSATDPDAGDSVTLTVDDDRFEIVNGALRVKADQSFDFETEPSVALTITATDSTGLSVSTSVSIEVTDVNEAPTVAVDGTQTLRLNEGTSVAGNTGFTVGATDPDDGDSVTLNVDDNRFEITNGLLRVKAGQNFDFESEPNIDLTITGTDQRGLTHVQSVTIAVTNVNEAPTVSVSGSQTRIFREGTSVAGDTGFSVTATDPDAGDSVGFSVDDDRFEITDGVLRVKAGQRFDYEREPTVDLVITGTDQGGLTHTQSVSIAITDVDEPPEMTVRGSQILNIFEGLSPSGNTGFRVSARDPEGRHGTIFSVDDDRFEITNGQLRLKTGQKFDARVEPRVEVTITAEETSGLRMQTSETVTLRVRDIAGVVFVGTKERTGVSITSSDLGSDKIAFDPTVTEVWHSMSGSDLVLEGFSQQTGRVVQTLTVTGMTQPFSRALLHNSGLPTLNKVTGSNPAGQETITGDSRANAIVGDAGENSLVGLAGYDRLFGGPDTDWADYSSSTAGVRVDLATGRGSRGHASGDRYTNVENVRGSRFNDVLTGDANANTLEGGAGDDTLDGRGGGDILRGGDGDDTVTYAMSNARVEVSIDDNGDSEYARSGHATGDQLYNIENLIGSRYDDRLTGNAEANLFVGGAGGDTIEGRGGPDTISYYNSAHAVTVDLGSTGGRQTGGDRRSDAYGDTLKNIENIEGSRYNDTLTGDEGRNVISGGRGADTIDGGDGVDTAAYTGSSSGVTAVLNEDGQSSKVGSRGDASGDILKNIEHLIGSRHNDILTGNSESNRFVGNGGSNFYRDGGTLYRAGGDTYDGGDGVDTVSYYGAAHGVTVNLGTGNGTGGRALGDRFVRKQGTDGVVRSTIENIVGTAHDDNLTGDAGANLFNAAEGADTVNGGGQDDGDVISYTDSEEWVRVDLALANAPQTGGGQTTRNGRTIINDARGDRLSNIENILGSDFNDQLYGNSGRNVFIDTEGADYMDGREGRDAEGREYVDTVSYARSTGAVSVDLADESATGGSATEGFQAGTRLAPEISGRDLDGDGTIENDQLINIEHVFGSRFSDTLKGDSGNNLFLGGRGGDNIDGRGGVDIVSYISSGSGVVIDLSAAAGSRARGGDATGDRLTNIESIEGSNDDDTLTNDSAFRAQSSISGQGGDDTIRGKSAVNNLNGGSGSDTIYGGGVISLLTGGSGKDYLHGAENTADIFRVYRSEAASSARQADEIHNFTGGTDKIYLPGLARVEVVLGQNVAGGSANDTIIKSGNDYFAVIVDATLSLDEDDFNVSRLFGETIAPPDVI